MRLFIYPYDYRNQFLLSCIGGMYEIKGVFTRKNWKYDHKRLEARGIQVFHTLKTEGHLEQCDGVLFYWNELLKLSDLRGCMLENIRICLCASKQVYCMLPLEKDEIQELSEFALAHQTQFHYMRDQEEVLEPIGYTLEFSYGYGMDAVWETSVYMDQYEAFEAGVLDLSYQAEKDDVLKTHYAGSALVVKGGSEEVYDKFCDMIEDTLSQETIAIL